MSRIFHRAAAVIAGMAVPLSAWALVAPANVDDEYVAIVQGTTITAEPPMAIVEYSESPEQDAGISRADRVDWIADPAAQPEATATTCCIWFYFHGYWYCVLC
jgi:hypothetical protein